MGTVVPASGQESTSICFFLIVFFAVDTCTIWVFFSTGKIRRKIFFQPAGPWADLIALSHK